MMGRIDSNGGHDAIRSSTKFRCFGSFGLVKDVHDWHDLVILQPVFLAITLDSTSKERPERLEEALDTSVA